MSRLVIMVLITFICSPQINSFKDNQLKYSRVKQAYKDKKENMLFLLKEKKIDKNKLQIYLRAFKKEQEIELWGKNYSDSKYKLIKTYRICKVSGVLGPKRESGDLQIPEGFYHVSQFNPNSNFYLSLGINYPNKSDAILGTKGNLGNHIFIHGNCVTIGCLPITDDQIKELYLFCVETKNNEQSNIPVTIFPSKLSNTEFNRLTIK